MWKYPTQRIDQATNDCTKKLIGYQNKISNIYELKVFVSDGWYVFEKSHLTLDDAYDFV